MPRSHRRRIALSLVAGIAVVGVITAYAFRDRLAGATFMRQLISEHTDHGPGTDQGSGIRDPGSGIGDQGPGGRDQEPASETPRAEVSLDLRRQQLAGIRTVEVTRAAMSPVVRTVGLVRYDETRLADVNVKVEGWIRDLRVDYTGQPVNKGDVLFTLYSPELVSTQTEYLLALKSRDQLRQSQIEDVRERAERLVDAARQRLTLWDLPAEQIRALEERREPQVALAFHSPVTGYVIEKQALQGMHVTAGQSLYKIADLSVVWVEADIYENEMAAVRIGTPARVTVDAYPGETWGGRVVFVHPTVEEKARTAKVRLQFANRGTRLRPGMYANVELRGPSVAGLFVPPDAVLDAGTERIVFVAQGDGYFEPRHVRVGRRLPDAIEILAGLNEGEHVATGATFFLDSESQLRAALQGYEAPPAGGPAAGPAPARPEITFQSQPDPPQAGENRFEVTVKDASGRPVTDAEVSVVFYMPAMPTMNMPAMRSETPLKPAGGGTYRGTGQVLTAGRWDVTVSVKRGGQRVGGRQFSIVASVVSLKFVRKID